MYLPQYHSIPENDEFWGKDFTDWVSVKKSKSLFQGHNQPKIPLDEFYYDLSKEDHVKWQVELAQKYGVDAFGVYHYWFNNEKNLLTKPAEILLKNKDLKTGFFFAWDNANWKRSWSNVEGNDWAPNAEFSQKKGPSILIPYILGNEADWKKHFLSLLPYFKDERYEKVDGKPLFIIFNYSKDIEKMCNYWESLAKEYDFLGVYFVFRYADKLCIPNYLNTFDYQPIEAAWQNKFNIKCVYYYIRKKLGLLSLKRYNYDVVWKHLLRIANRKKQPNKYHGGFVSYDDTPRRGLNGRVILGATPQKFEKYLSKLLNISAKQKKEFLFVTAWNEWGEGAYLEPDSVNKYEYLEALKRAKEKSFQFK